MALDLTRERDDVLRAWQEALRSGKYEQGPGCLRKDGKWCCLGVLCDVLGPDEWLPEDDTDTGECYAGDMVFERSEGPSSAYSDLTLPQVIADRYFDGNQDPNLETAVYYAHPATALNDDLGCSFNEIADAIERTFFPAADETD